MKKKCNVVMLATDKKQNKHSMCDLFLCTDGKLRLGNQLIGSDDAKQYLYILSDDEIKEGDWLVLLVDNMLGKKNDIIQVIKTRYGHTDIVKANGNKHWFASEVNFQKECYKKIIATTSPELWNLCRMTSEEFKAGNHTNCTCDGSGNLIPKISLDFVEVYIKAYNKGEQIKEVMVEYHSAYEYMNGKSTYIGDTSPKISSNGTISITPVEERKYTREEVINILYDFTTYQGNMLPKSRITDWFNKHY